MINNTWFKLAAVSLAGILISFAILWGIGEFSRYNRNGYMNMGYGYSSGMNIQGRMNGNIQGVMSGNMQGGMGMMGGMGMH